MEMTETLCGTLVGSLVYLKKKFRSVIRDRPLQPPLIKTNDGEGDLAQRPIKHFRICSSPHGPLHSSTV